MSKPANSSPSAVQDLKASHQEILARMRALRSTAPSPTTTVAVPLPDSTSILEENLRLTDMTGDEAMDLLRRVIRASAEASVFRSCRPQG